MRSRNIIVITQYDRFFEHCVVISSRRWHKNSPKQKGVASVDDAAVKRAVAYQGILFRGGGVQQIQLRTEDRENGDLGVVAPYSEILEAAVIWYFKTIYDDNKFICHC